MTLKNDLNNISSSLQRYYNNKDEINEKQKKYFREKWYIKNRSKVIEYQRVYRLGKRVVLNKVDRSPTTISRNCRISLN